MTDERYELARVLSRAARKYLGIPELEYWDFSIAEAQADHLLASKWLKEHDRAISERTWGRAALAYGRRRPAAATQPLPESKGEQ